MLMVNGKEKEEMVRGLVPEQVVPPVHVAEMRPELVRIPPTFESPVPRSETKDEPPMFRFVVEAVMKDEYAVDEEYGNVILPAASIVVVAVEPNDA